MATDTMRRTPGSRPRPSGPRGLCPAQGRSGGRRSPQERGGSCGVVPPASRVTAPRHTRPVTGPVTGRAPRPRVRSPRMPFILLLVGLLGGALVCLLVISTTLAQGAFRDHQPAGAERQPGPPGADPHQRGRAGGEPGRDRGRSQAARHAAEPPPGLHRPQNREDRHRQAVQRRGRDQRSRVHSVTPQDPTRRPQTNRRDDRRPPGACRGAATPQVSRPGPMVCGTGPDPSGP